MSTATGTERLTLTLGGQESEAASLEELRGLVERFLVERQYAEIWLSQGTARALSLLVNRGRAWIMYLVNIDEQCWHSVGSDSCGAADTMLEFVLASGQRDEYPASWAVPIEQALGALEYFFLRQDRSPLLSWAQDF